MPTQKEIVLWIHGDRMLAMNLYCLRTGLGRDVAHDCFMFSGTAVSPLVSRKRRYDRENNIVN